MYKITICCEYNGKQLLTFNEKSIDTRKYPNIRRDIYTYLKKSQVSFMKNINILHKESIEETDDEYKTLSIKKIEFVCHREITNKQFVWFIRYLKAIGFDTCSYTNTIKFVEDGEVVFNYIFKDVVPYNSTIRFRNEVTKKYKTQLIV
jgi:hypothetical protein